MKERPIIFSAPMVRAILDGRKTQTRRVVKVTHRTPGLAAALEPLDPAWARPDLAAELCPYGVPGDRLWVREGWQGPLWPDDDPAPKDGYQPKYCEYRADGGPTPWFADAEGDLHERWASPIHMPRWASRITLEIVGVRVERLTAISEFAAVAEGIERYAGLWNDYTTPRQGWIHPINSYRSLWESINGAGSWEANPWVWVLEFRRMK